MPADRLGCILPLFFLAAAHLGAQSPTATTLSLSAASLAWPVPETLTAAVTNGANPISPGLVKFCNATAASCQGAALLGQAQLTTGGTASINVVLPIGTYSVKAEFVGTNPNRPSNSANHSFSVIGVRPSTTTISALNSPPYTLSASVVGHGSQTLSGTVTFLDITNANYSASAALGSTTTTSAYAPENFPAGNQPAALATGDFNGDGAPDIAVGDATPDSNGLYTVTLFLSGRSAPISFELPYVSGGVTALAVGDFNNDGNLDLAIASGTTDTVSIAFGDGAGDFSVPVVLSTQLDPSSIAVSDFNGDGNADLAVTSEGQSTVTIWIGNGQGTFTQGSQFATGVFPFSVVAGDFNRDGKQDLAIANFISGNVSVLLGKGDGTFTPAGSPLTGLYPVWIAAGDFNGDGIEDLAVTNAGSATMTILLGDGRGDFAPAAQSPSTGKGPNSAAVGDFNHDGIEDLAVANANDDTVTLLFGKGDGTFPTTQTLPLAAGVLPHAVTALDFNADGREDLAIAGSGNNTAVIVLNTVTVTATATLSGSIPGPGEHYIQAAYSGNTNYGNSSSFIGVTVPGAPIPTTTSVTAEPAGVIALGQTVQLFATVSPSLVGSLTPTGNVAFYNGTTLLGIVPLVNGVAVLNFTFSTAAAQDLSAGYGGDSNFILSSSAPLPLTPSAPIATATTLSVSATSVTKGSLVTLTASVTSGGKALTHGIVTFCNAKANFCEDGTVYGTASLKTNGSAALKLALPLGANSILAAFGGTADAKPSQSAPQTVTVTSSVPDLVSLSVTGAYNGYNLTASVAGSWPTPRGSVSFVDTSNNNLVLATATLSSGMPQFAQSASLPSDQSQMGIPYAAAAADFNGDGKPDLAVVNTNSNTVSILLGNGDGTFAPVNGAIPSTVNLSGPEGIAVGDFNGDGVPDLAIPSFHSGTVTILLGNGNGTFTNKAVLLNGTGNAAAGRTPWGIIAGDFNGDGKLDLAVANTGASSITILLGNGDGTFSVEPDSPAVGNEPNELVAADFNGDGKLDLAVSNYDANTITILLGNGDGTFTPGAATLATGRGPFGIASGDFNNDGKPDLAITNNLDNTLTILLNAGGGLFTPAANLPAGPTPYQIATGDFNGDGNTDLVVSDQGGTGFTVLLGNGDGTFTSESVSSSASGPSGLAVADFNGDGSPDVAVTGYNSSSVSVLLNSATGTAVAQGIPLWGGGTHQIEATYTATAPNVSGNSNAVAESAALIPTATTLTASASNVTAGKAFTATAKVSPLTAYNYTLSGAVSLYDGQTLLATNPVTNGTASFTVTLTTAGTHSLFARYNGSPAFSADGSPLLKIVVAP